MPEINEVIGGYRLRSLLQTGATSQVFEVVEPQSNRHFAMKVLLPESEGKAEIRHTLFHEAEVGQKLRHENVIHILKVNRGEHSPHFIMEFFPSGSVRNRLMAKDLAFVKDNGMAIFKQAATGLAYMHGCGWVHCDVKPDNMLVNAAGQLKMIDFAISRKKSFISSFGSWITGAPRCASERSQRRANCAPPLASPNGAPAPPRPEGSSGATAPGSEARASPDP